MESRRVVVLVAGCGSLILAAQPAAASTAETSQDFSEFSIEALVERSIQSGTRIVS